MIAITGLGGQGKSTLAARALAELPKDAFWDWRDCKEESNTFHTQIVRLIERVTNGRLTAAEFTSEKTESVIRRFFELTLSVKGVFVFDNIDQYVDVRNFQAVEAVHFFIESALKTPGASKFVFTARPKLDYSHPSFLQIPLVGLSESETMQLFESRRVTITKDLVHDVWELTQGHPLWINLICMQALTRRLDLVSLISRVRAGKEAGLPGAMLSEIWRTLTLKQQQLMRYLAETVRPETERQIARYVSSRFNYNQFSKALRQLKALDLVVVKSPTNAPETLELHPLLREHVRRQFSKSERGPYISAIIVFFDELIGVYRDHLGRDLPFEVLQSWTGKAELLINRGDYVPALAVLDEIRRPLLRLGYNEEFLRLGQGIFGNMDWREAATIESRVYDDVFKDWVEIFEQIGRSSEADEWMRHFEQSIPGATARYVALCDMRTYVYWLRESYELAKEWGRKGVELKAAGQLDTRHDCQHNLALAQRDSGEIESALATFLAGGSLAEVCNPQTIQSERGASYYGNIGRCLQLGGDFEQALPCLIKAAWLLEHATDDLRLINRGWAALWLAEWCEAQKRLEEAFVCYLCAYSRFRQVSPPRANTAKEAAEALSELLKVEIDQSDSEAAERNFRNFVNQERRF